MRAISTEMQTLSQRLSRGMTQALLGYGDGFDIMENSYARFGTNLTALRKPVFSCQSPSNSIPSIWDRTFSANSNRLTIQSLIEQKSNLLLLSERVNQANTSDALLNILSRDFSQLATTRLSPREQALAAQLPFHIALISRYTNSLLSGESYNPEWVPQLSLSIERLNKVLAAFKNGDAALGIAPLSDHDLLRPHERIVTNSKSYDQLKDLVPAQQHGAGQRTYCQPGRPARCRYPADGNNVKLIFTSKTRFPGSALWEKSFLLIARFAHSAGARFQSGNYSPSCAVGKRKQKKPGSHSAPAQ